MVGPYCYSCLHSCPCWDSLAVAWAAGVAFAFTFAVEVALAAGAAFAVGEAAWLEAVDPLPWLLPWHLS